MALSGTTGYLCTKQSDNSLKCSTNPANLTPGNGEITIKQGSKIMSFTLNQSINTGIELDVGTYTGVTMNGYNTNSNNYCVAVDANTIECKSSGGSGSVGESMSYGALTNNKYCKYIVDGRNVGSIVCDFDVEGGSGDSLWKLAKITANGMTSTGNLLTPNDTGQDLFLGGNIWHDGYLKIQALGAASAYRQNYVIIHDQGMSIGELANRTAGLGVHGPITVGKYMLTSGEMITRPGYCPEIPVRNTISIFASGSEANEHFEILGTPRILIGVKNGGYLYFNDENQLMINTSTKNNTSTLNVNGPIKVGNECSSKQCGSINKGEIRYFESGNTGYFAGCTKVDGSYKRRRLTIGDTDLDIANNNCNTSLGIPYDSGYYQTNLVQQQPDCM